MLRQKHLPFIDALRGLAVLGVFAVHAGQQVKGLPHPIETLIEQGARGVQLFFVISAFTLFLSLSKRSYVEKNPVLNFFIRRFFRIAPMFYCAMLYYLLKDGLGPRYWLGDASSITFSNILASISFTNAWYPYYFNSVVPGGWSVAVEMFFYLLVPFLFHKVKSLKSAILLSVITLLLSKFLNLILAKIALISSPRLWSDFLALWFPVEFPVFCLGFVLFFLILKLEKSEADSIKILTKQLSIETTGRVLTAISILLAVILAFHCPIVPVQFAYGFCFTMLAFSLALHPTKFIVNQFFQYLGKISYSAYLVHFSLLPIAKELNDSLDLVPIVKFIIVFFFVIIGTMALSTLTYKLIETNGILLGRYLISRLELTKLR